MEFFKDPITGEEYVKGEIRTTDFITTTKVDYLGLIVGVKEIDDKNFTPIDYHRLILKPGETLVLRWDIGSENIDLEVIQQFNESLQKFYPDNNIVSMPKECVSMEVIAKDCIF